MDRGRIMAVDIFMVIPSGSANPPMTITADPVADPYYKATFANAAAVELRQFSLAAENPATIGSATSGAGAGKLMFNELFIEKSVDMLSRSLFTMAAKGAHFTKLQLYVRRAGTTGSKPYLTYSFGTVFVSKIDWTTSSGDEEPLERVTFVYGAMALIYSPQKPDGTLGTAVKTGWSVVTNSDASPEILNPV